MPRVQFNIQGRANAQAVFDLLVSGGHVNVGLRDIEARGGWCRVTVTTPYPTGLHEHVAECFPRMRFTSAVLPDLP